MDEARLVKLEKISASGLFTDRPCLVYSLCGVGVADATNVFTVYDGHNTTGRDIMRLVSIAYSSDFRLFASPLFFAKGLYVEFTTNGAEFFAQFMELGR